MNAIQCRCGRFLGKPWALAQGDRLVQIRGDCSRCGPTAEAHPEGWWWDWELWDWGK